MKLRLLILIFILQVSSISLATPLRVSAQWHAGIGDSIVLSIKSFWDWIWGVKVEEPKKDSPNRLQASEGESAFVAIPKARPVQRPLPSKAAVAAEAEVYTPPPAPEVVYEDSPPSRETTVVAETKSSAPVMKGRSEALPAPRRRIAKEETRSEKTAKTTSNNNFGGAFGGVSNSGENLDSAADSSSQGSATFATNSRPPDETVLTQQQLRGGSSARGIGDSGDTGLVAFLSDPSASVSAINITGSWKQEVLFNCGRDFSIITPLVNGEHVRVYVYTCVTDFSKYLPGIKDRFFENWHSGNPTVQIGFEKRRYYMEYDEDDPILTIKVYVPNPANGFPLAKALLISPRPGQETEIPVLGLFSQERPQKVGERE